MLEKLIIRQKRVLLFKKGFSFPFVLKHWDVPRAQNQNPSTLVTLSCPWLMIKQNQRMHRTHWQTWWRYRAEDLESIPGRKQADCTPGKNLPLGIRAVAVDKHKCVIFSHYWNEMTKLTQESWNILTNDILFCSGEAISPRPHASQAFDCRAISLSPIPWYSERNCHQITRQQPILAPSSSVGFVCK